MKLVVKSSVSPFATSDMLLSNLSYMMSGLWRLKNAKKMLLMLHGQLYLDKVV